MTRATPPSRTAPRTAFALGLLALYVLADLALRPSLIGVNRIMPWYPSAGIGLGLLAVGGTGWAPALVSARLAIYAWNDPSLLLDVAWLAPRLLEAIAIAAAYAIAATIVRRRVADGLGAWRLRHGAWLCAAILVGALLAAGAYSLRAVWEGGRSAPGLLIQLSLFAAGDATGSLVVLPLILTSFRRLFRPDLDAGVQDPDLGPPPPSAAGTTRDGTERPSGAERVAQVLAVLGASAIAAAAVEHGQFGHPAVRLVCLAVLVWLAIRSGIAGAAAVLAAYGAVCLATAAAGVVAPADVPGIQTTLITFGIVGVLLGTLRTEAVANAARYWHFLAGSGEGVWRTAPDGRTVYANARMLQLLGRPAAEVVGRPPRAFVEPEAREAWDRAWAAPAPNDEVVHETRLVRPDGATAAVLVRGRTVRDAAGAPVGAVALVTDVTRLRAAEASGQRAQTLLEAAFRSSRDAMILLRQDDGRVVEVNDVWCELTGKQREAVLGRTQAELRLLGDPADAARLAAAVREHGSVRDFEIPFERHVAGVPAGRGHALLSAYPVLVEGTTYLLVVGRDITVERRREMAEGQLRRLEELGRLAGSVSHDFNNLLTVALAYAQIAKSAALAGEVVPAADLEEIERAALRGQELTRRLLAFSRNQAVEPQVVDLCAAVEAARGMMTSVLSVASLHVECAREPVPILADPAQIDQVLLNLAVNARDAMTDGGTVRVTVDRVHVAPGEASTLVGPDALPGWYGRLRFGDTGVGMDEVTQSRAFEPFFTTKGEGMGTGLGLAVVFGIVRQAHGGVRVDSRPGEGATFTIVWPIAGAAPRLAAAAGGDGASRADAGAVRPRLLVAEDDATVARIVRRVLEGAGYEVEAVSDGARALARIGELARDGRLPDVVLSDVLMPNMGGRALAERLAVAHPGLPVVLMSGHTGDGDVREGLSNVRVAVVGKPFDLVTLRTAVAAALQGSGAHAAVPASTT